MFPNLILAILIGLAVGVDSVLWPCRFQEDCSSVVANAKCSEYFYCYCPAGYVFSTDVTQCLKESGFGVACTESVQCSHMLSGATCENGKCGCAEGYTYARGKCRKLAHLHSACSETIDCEFSGDRESVVCKERTCECAEGFYKRSNNVCRRLSTKPCEPCLVQSDCQSKELSLVCEKQKCVINGTSTCDNSPSSGISSSKTNLRDIGTQISLNSFKDDNPSDDINYKPLRTVSTLTSDSNNKNSLSSYESSMRDESTQFGDPCTSEGEPCPGLTHSICRKALCHCQYGYYEKDSQCMPELGEEAQDESFCPFKGRFENKRCLCPYNTFYGPNMRMCVKPTTGFEGSCVYNEQCSVYGAAFCSKITPKTCQCHAYATYNKEKELCEMKEGVGEYCEIDSMCSVPNTRCNEQKSCVCKDNYLENDGKCMPAIGAECKESEDCVQENSECVKVTNEKRSTRFSMDEKKYCTCKKQFVHADGQCLKKATKYEDDCKTDDQCTPLLGEMGKCINRTCKCDIIHHHKDDRCYEKTPLDAPCERSSQCFVTSEPDTVECRNSQCKCKVNTTTDLEAQACIKPKPTKNSSNRPSPLKVITLTLFASAMLLTGSALKEAYYP
ncbi:rh5-interacting protein-like [Culicoides brevitarsis]|uniref:rh5-interacting protein-like n=1 Tax=Culicoides brevitarsis TaxID=469753 RepID=UPI00307B1BF2